MEIRENGRDNALQLYQRPLLSFIITEAKSRAINSVQSFSRNTCHEAHGSNV